MKRILRTVGLGLLAIAACLAAFVWYVVARVTAEPHPVPAAAHPNAARPEVALGSPAEGRVKVYAFRTGDTLVPSTQFWSGLDGCVGARAIWYQGRGTEPAWVPVYAFLIEHPVAGRVLVDAGLSEAQGEPGHYSFAKGGIAAGFWRDSRNRLPATQQLAARLGRFGLRPADVGHVILTHLHEDHLGELPAFPHAVVHVSRQEWEDRWRVAYGPSLEAVQRWDVFEFDSGRFRTFEASKDLFGDGTVILLPTFGHTLGHTSVLVNVGESQLLLPGDAVYTLRHLDPEALAACNYFGPRGLETQRDSIRRIVALQAELPGLAIAPSHDAFSYGTTLLPATLDDGVLSVAERDMLRAFQRLLYDDGRLRTEVRPRYVSPERGDPGGRWTAKIP
jgi:glyoxylase-like metal-dependent hydrolase (beta-lactamase superfamily II)